MAEKRRPCAARGCRHWHNEADNNCDSPGLMDACASYTAALAPVAEELLGMLAGRKPWWPHEPAIDRAYVAKLHALYGAEINLVEKFLLWEDHFMGKPARERTNPRLAFHKWCIHGVTLKKKYARTPEPPPPLKKEGRGGFSENPPQSPFSKGGGPVQVSGHAPERVKRILAEAALKTGETINPTPSLPLGRGGAGGSAGIKEPQWSEAESAAGKPARKPAVAGGARESNPPRQYAQLTPEELEVRRQEQLAWMRKQKEENHV